LKESLRLPEETVMTRKRAQGRAQKRGMTRKQFAAMDFEPWRDENGETGNWLDPEYVNNPHLIYARLDYALMHQSKPELMAGIKGMVESNDGDVFIL
jgi:hypothetical protein